MVDAFEARICGRPHRKAMAVSAALKDIKKRQGKQFDPEVHAAFVSSLETIREIEVELADEEVTEPMDGVCV